MLSAQQDNCVRGSWKALVAWRAGRGQNATLVVIPPAIPEKTAQVSEANGQKGTSVKTVSSIESFLEHTSYQALNTITSFNA